MSRLGGTSRTTSYDEVTQYKIVNSVEPATRARSKSRERADGSDEYYKSQVTRSRSKSTGRPLSRAIANVGLDVKGIPIVQIVYYQSGVGSGKLTAVNKATQGAFGDGLNEKVCEAYTFLVNNYGPGDEIFIFGFSRGAYTARSLASFVCQIGLLSPGMMDYFNDIFTAYKLRDRRAGETGFRDMEWSRHYVRPGELGFETRQRERVTRYDWIRRWAHLHAKVKVVGVFDTVGSIGMSGWVPQPGDDVDWHATKLHPKIECAFHSLALDEHRGSFPPTIFFLDQACKDAGVKLRQCWFPGFHSCIGGESDPKYDVNSVDEVTFAWMIDQLTRYNLLQINERALHYPILDRLSMDLEPNGHHPTPPRNAQEVHGRRIDWSDGQLIETDTLFWQVASQVATQRWDYTRKPGQYEAYDDGTRQQVDYSAFREEIHPSVWHRTQTRNYEPRCLPLDRWKRHRVGDGAGYEWVKASRSGLIQVRIPEYKIPHIPTYDSGMAHWTGCLEQRIVPGEVLRKLDYANGIVRSSPRPESTRIDSGYSRDGHDGRYLSPMSPRSEPSYGTKSADDAYSERDTVTVRTRSPRPPSSAADYSNTRIEFGERS
ncbi:hypothetical protein LTR78_009909 [Recurvomyces mirabilis]|uniref:T6SS Phospholipase effector Tle1-like catalytic domain-containing protein n=1 Tax=Recurvomyces mirabilis TaxID=574656 RepID=A0AAE0WGE1_9PEZI|nr:hypothetical protein LTR78_009909 [Recurvomyces mirabilis]KAK5150584.1 hypothetical protein LTS14_010078 [Recurvomyces mirabilis]